MYDDKPTHAETRQAMQMLRDLGVATINIEFSGGNDEGGADGADFLDADGKPVAVPVSRAYEDRGYRNGGEFNDGWVVYEQSVEGAWNQTKRRATPEEAAIGTLHKVIESPIYSRWGSFAGEFYVQGNLTWDVAAGTHRLTGQESVEQYDDFEYEG